MFPVFVEHLGRFFKDKVFDKQFLSVEEQSFTSLGIFEGYKRNIFLE